MILKGNEMCFACGPENPIGLRLQFRWENEEYATTFVPKLEHEGFAGVIHGGLLTTVLDEAMARMVWELGKNAVTAEIKVRFYRMLKAGEEISVRARIAKESGRLLSCSAEATDKNDARVAAATAKFLKLKPL